jgi:hypothetical protein
MGTVITNLKARFGVDTTDFKKGLKDGEQATAAFKDAAGGTLDEFAGMFGVNMSAVSDAIGSASKALNFLGQSFKGAAVSSNVLSISLKVLKFALIATGIGAIVVVLGSLISYFTKSGEGVDKFARILAQLKSIVNNVTDRLAIFGKGVYEIMTGKFKQGWQDMTGAFKGMGDEIKEDWKATGALADAEDKLEDREIALINSLEERRAKAAELRLLAKETIGDEQKKLSLIEQAEALYKSVYGDQLSVERERLRIMKEKLAIQISDPTDEQRAAIEEQEKKISSLYREQSEQLKSLNREKKAALAAVTEELALEKAKTSQVAITMATISNIQMPDFGALIDSALAPLPKIQEAVSKIAIDLTETLNNAFENIANGMGEFLGALMTGDAGVKDFGRVIASVFADLAINVGRIAIGAGIAVLGVKKALESMNPYVAIAAGIALVAIGSAIKGSLKSAASGGSGGSALYGYGSGSASYGSPATVSPQAQKVQINGTFKIQGRDLVTLINDEDTRKGITT